MVKPCRKITAPHHSPEFFKIYMPDLCSQRLRIPPAFHKYFNGVLPNKLILTTPRKRSRWVDVNKVDNNLYFQEGWEEFVQDHSLEYGDFLIFTFAGNSKFYVNIFGKDGCKKDVPFTSRKTENQSNESKKSEKIICKDGYNPINKRTSLPTDLLDVEENNGATKGKRKFVSRAAYPSFKVVLTPSYVTGGFLNVPSTFHETLLKLGEGVTLQRLGKSWWVKLIGRGKKLSLAKGWGKFVKNYSLQVGDVCKFKLIGGNNDVLKVHIERRSG